MLFEEFSFDILVAGVCCIDILLQSNRTARGGRILHGTTSQRFAHPYMVEIRITDLVSNSEEFSICSGSILTPKVVLTAAHCFRSRDDNSERVEVLAGTKSKYNDPITFQRREAREIVTSPKFSLSSDPTLTKDDVALIILDASLDYNEEVNHIAVLNSEAQMMEDVQNGIECLMLGFGETGKQKGELRGDTTYLITNDACRRKICEIFGHNSSVCMNEVLGPGELCTLSEGTSGCSGDSGGPLMCNHQIYGVLSFYVMYSNSETKCKAGKPNIFENINIRHKVWRLLFDDKELSELARYPEYKTQPNAPERAHHFVVEIRVYTGDNQEWGQYTGTIISEKLILTACNCVKEDDGTVVDASEVEVIAGTPPYIQSSKAKRIITHQACARRFLKTGKKGRYAFENDVAFLVLETSLRFGEHVKPIEIGEPKFEKQLINGNVECHVYGYGTTKPFSYNIPPMKTLSIGTIWLTGEKKCQKRLCRITQAGDELCTRRNYFSSGWLCGFNDDTSSCFGHTGGPVVCKGQVFGVDSYLLPCKERKCRNGRCHDWPSLFMNSVAISQLYGVIKNDHSLFYG